MCWVLLERLTGQWLQIYKTVKMLISFRNGWILKTALKKMMFHEDLLRVKFRYWCSLQQCSNSNQKSKHTRCVECFFRGYNVYTVYYDSEVFK